MKPVTGRTHQLRAHAAHMGHPIIGDTEIFRYRKLGIARRHSKPSCISSRAVLADSASRATGKLLDITAPLPQHMQQSFNLLGLDATAL